MTTTLAPFTTRYARSAMVCTIDHLAVGAGVAMLRAGGTAADAAIATNAVLAVTAQHACGLGGDLFALVHRAGDDAPAALNASGRAGSGADPERLRAEGYTTMPRAGDIRAVPLPGCVDGWMALHDRFGRLELGELLEPARRYAADGFPAAPTLAAVTDVLAGVPEADDFVGREPLRAGDVVRRPGLARALTAIAAEGRGGFYEGEFGEGLLALGAGEYTEEDLTRRNADWVQPLGVEVWGRRVWTIPPSSQGYIALAAAWIAERLPLPEDPDDSAWAHLLVEAARQAGYDRDDVLYEGADGAALISPERLAPRLEAISAERAADVEATFAGGGTAYMCAVDEQGLAISLIQSNFIRFGALVVVPGVRIFLQNRGAAFSLVPGHPAEYGPRRRPPHTLSPLLVTGPNGRLDALLGTMGGDSQPHTLLQLLARRYVAGQSPGEALAAPRWLLKAERGRGGSVVAVEAHAPDAWFTGLAKRGHEVARRPSWAYEFGHAHLISAETDYLAGAADPRALTGAAGGY